jgi:hypothetical protein
MVPRPPPRRSTVPNTNSASTIAEVTVIQESWTLVFPSMGGPSSSSPSRVRQVIIAYPQYTSTASITGAAMTAMTLMSNCWLAAEVDMSPGGRCGPHTNQITRSAATARGSQIEKTRSPWFGSAGPAAGAEACSAAAIRTPRPGTRS